MPPLRRTGSGNGNLNENVNGKRVIPNRRRQAQQEAAKRASQQNTRIRYERNDDEKPTPLMLRILLWLGIILLCFVLGYLGTSWVVEFLNRKLLLKPENRIENQEDLSHFEQSEQERTAGNPLTSGNEVQQVSLNLYHVRNGNTLAEIRKNFILRTNEENIRDAVNEIISISGVPNAGKIKLLHVFRDDDTAFLDMSGQFASALSSMGRQKSLLLITGIVRTMQENFPPLSQVRFLLDSKAPTPNSGNSNDAVDLSSVWKLPKKTS